MRREIANGFTINIETVFDIEIFVIDKTDWFIWRNGRRRLIRSRGVIFIFTAGGSNERRTFARIMPECSVI